MTDSPRPLFGPPPRAHARDMYAAPPVVKSVAAWIEDLRSVKSAGTRPATPDVPPTVKHKVDFEEALAPTTRRRKIR